MLDKIGIIGNTPRTAYNGYANKTLWPLFHHRVDLTAYERSYGEGYERVNARFAEVLRPQIQPDDIIWIHDYHLIPIARDLRRLGIKNRIGFFLHTPWPARQLLVTLPHHRRLVESLFAYDLIGLQTKADVSNLIDYMTGQEIMTRLRVREYNSRMLDPEKVVGKETTIRIFNIGLPILSIILFGVGRWYFRRRKNLALQEKA